MEINRKIDELKEGLIKSSQELVKIKSVEEPAKEGMPYGEGVHNVLNKTLEICQNLGFKTVNIDGYVGYAEYGEGEDYVAVLGHLDVVPEGDGWIYPPYGAEIHDGKIYGRGTMDDKAPMVAALYGLKAIKDLNLPLSKRVRIIFGTNEESGCNEMPHYLEKEKAPVAGFTPDAEYPIIYGEKGITIFDVTKKLTVKSTGDVIIKSLNGGQRANVVPDYCEALISTKNTEAIINAAKEFKSKTGYDVTAEIKDNMIVVKSVGVAAHGSLPHLGKNAIMQMFKFLGELPLGKCDIADYINFFNKYVGFETDGKSFGVYLEDKESGKLSFNIGTVSMDEEKVSMALNLRYPVTFKYENMMNPFNEKIEAAGMEIENMLHQKPLFFPADHPIIKSLQKVYTEQTGKEAKLLAIGGGTYAKEMPNIVAFGPIFPGKPDLDHQANEYIEVDDLILNAKIYGHAIYELAK
ncbi:diguanylate cyclase [Clostridium carboxidivorans P7]|uniref:Dipeptidase n=1 Tax=Clostridium carboxidivorans P7 TaxID=536227 RepID=C6Q291_9CLOT|nr:dipeptidase PepV [Clostridium carboxidivorans]AKN32071.1 diguanylate cyclase [Clostridium carboxidivorans P7]EET84384.1 dipeptidase [Clostridium carboxidivorans P7]EFG86061.1 dipeptidase PepV [Clostridium carboxidivorans P7]